MLLATPLPFAIKSASTLYSGDSGQLLLGPLHRPPCSSCWRRLAELRSRLGRRVWCSCSAWGHLLGRAQQQSVRMLGGPAARMSATWAFSCLDGNGRELISSRRADLPCLGLGEEFLAPCQSGFGKKLSTRCL